MKNKGGTPTQVNQPGGSGAVEGERRLAELADRIRQWLKGIGAVERKAPLVDEGDSCWQVIDRCLLRSGDLKILLDTMRRVSYSGQTLSAAPFGKVVTS